MDPVTFIGALASVIEIANFLSAKNIGSVTRNEIADEYEARQNSGVIRDVLTNKEQVLHIAETVLTIKSVNEPFLDRIKNCYAFLERIGGGQVSDADVVDATNQTRRCICVAINSAASLNGGRIPDEMRQIFNDVGCSA